MDTRDVRQFILLAIVVTLFPLCLRSGAQTAAWQAAVAGAAARAPDAEIVVVDLASGRVAAAHRLAEAARTLAYPGSTLKPIALYGLIQSGKWDPERRIACSRTLYVAGRELNCSHPEMPPLNAQGALTWSCNTYFATVARGIAPGELRTLLEPSGLLATTGLAESETEARFRPPKTTDETQLTLLGVDGIEVTPLELVRAYRWLGLQFGAHPEARAAQIVLAGIRDSASFGMAENAGLGGVAVAGKTGTAGRAAGGQTHGWFVGLAPAQHPQIALVVYLPVGRGADAAAVAGEVLKESPLRAR